MTPFRFALSPLFLSPLFLFALALPARALDAYSNVPANYVVGGYQVNAAQSVGFRFDASATGTLTGFRAAMNSYQAGPTATFVLDLYADAGGVLGTRLGSYAGTNTGLNYGATTTALANVAATGPAVTLTRGSTYWLVAATTAAGGLYWNSVSPTATQPATYTRTGAPGSYVYFEGRSSVFAVEVAPVPEPAPLAALGLGGLALLRRRRL